MGNFSLYEEWICSHTLYFLFKSRQLNRILLERKLVLVSDALLNWFGVHALIILAIADRFLFVQRYGLPRARSLALEQLAWPLAVVLLLKANWRKWLIESLLKARLTHEVSSVVDDSGTELDVAFAAALSEASSSPRM